ncbi:MAG: hypothetical protein WBH47_23825 [Streptosporangiaceae bacterium]
MTSGKPRPRWVFLVSPRWLAWHAFAVVAAWGMLWLGDWQFHRAEGGNALSWAYTFEWPIFVVFGVVFWGKTIVDEWHQQGAAAAAAQYGYDPLGPSASVGPDLPAGAHTAAVTDDDAAGDPELAAYNAYLARLNSRPAAR